MLTLNAYPTLIPFERMATATIPAIELRETADSVIVTAHLPGVDPRDIQIQATDRSLTFWGQQQRQLRNHYRYTVSYEQFQHTIPLPVAVRDSQAQVAFRAAEVIVTLPKANRSAPFETSSFQTITEAARRQGKQLGHQLRRAKTWLGYRLQDWSDRLLED